MEAQPQEESKDPAGFGSAFGGNDLDDLPEEEDENDLPDDLPAEEDEDEIPNDLAEEEIDEESIPRAATERSWSEVIG